MENLGCLYKKDCVLVNSYLAQALQLFVVEGF